MVLKYSHRLILLLISFIVIVSLSVIIYAVFHERRLIRDIAFTSAENTADGVLNDFYVSMRHAGKWENREFLNALGQIQGIEEVRIVRSPIVEAQRGIDVNKRAIDEPDSIALKGEKVKIIEDAGARFSMPIFFEKACQRCHIASVGSVAGVISVRVALDSYEGVFSKNLRWLFMGGIGIAVGFSLIAAMTLYLFLLKPKKIFNEAVNILGKTISGEKMNIEDKVEVSLIIEELERMVGRLKNFYFDLEKKVGERISELTLINRRLGEFVITDSVTGVFNRKHFDIRLDEEIANARRNAKPLSVILAGIDNFKLYNDTHGSKEGDFILKGVATCLMAALRNTDIFARYGTNIFAVILPETDKDTAGVISERIRSNVERQSFPHGETMPGGKMTVSAAFVIHPDDGLSKEELLKQAESALNRAQEKGGNRAGRALPLKSEAI